MPENKPIEIIRKRARLLKELRSFFYARDFLEVDVPVLARNTVTDANIESLTIMVDGEVHYLQTSPEFFLKRLLSQGLGSCFYLGKAFRAEESGPLHAPEFTMCEWYWIGKSYLELAEQVVEFISVLEKVFDRPVYQKKFIAYRDIFTSILGVNPHQATVNELQKIAARESFFDKSQEKSFWLDYLFSFFIQPVMKGLTVVYDFPECQSALAKTASNERGEMVAKRFEVFWNDVELANGYEELNDTQEQRARFKKDNQQRFKNGKKIIKLDQEFLAALDTGIPDCSGVAMGVDRLLMCLLGDRSLPLLFSS